MVAVIKCQKLVPTRSILYTYLAKGAHNGIEILISITAFFIAHSSRPTHRISQNFFLRPLFVLVVPPLFWLLSKIFQNFLGIQRGQEMNEEKLLNRSHFTLLLFENYSRIFTKNIFQFPFDVAFRAFCNLRVFSFSNSLELITSWQMLRTIYS